MIVSYHDTICSLLSVYLVILIIIKIMIMTAQG